MPAESLVDDVGAVLTALCVLGVTSSEIPAADRVVEIAGRRVRLETVCTSVARPGWAQALGSRVGRRSLGIVVADQVPASTRKLLDELGWGWLDRRGHLKVRHGQLWIDADVPPAPRIVAPTVAYPLAGPVACGVAILALVSSPEPLAGIRATARTLGASPAGVSAAASRLVDAGLLTRDRRAVIPELFWALAEAWRPAFVGLATADVADHRGVVAAGSKAAAALGAPVAVTADYPLELVVADQSAAASVLRHAGGPAPVASAPARLAVGPSPVAATASEAGDKVGGVSIANLAVVALTLAGDPSRGAEVLEGWDTPGRVW